MIRQFSEFRSEQHGFRFPNRFDTPPLPLIERPIIFGLCGGMCFAALDYFSVNKAVPALPVPPDESSELYRYLVLRQRDSLSLQVLSKLIAGMLFGDAELAQATVEDEIPRLRHSLDLGIPMVLVLIRVHWGNPTHNHQVLAIGYELNEMTNHMEIALYDPNHPFSTPRITLLPHPTPPHIRFRQSTGEPLRGFFVLDHESKLPPEI